MTHGEKPQGRGWLWSPTGLALLAFLAIAAFFGAGLTFAGATGTCALAMLLMKMPWNRPLAPPSESGGSVCAAGGGATSAAPTRPRS